MGSNRPPAGMIQRSLTAARQGDGLAFQLLEKSSRDHDDVFRQTLPIVSLHIRPPIPPFEPGQSSIPRKAELLASIALQILRDAMTDGKPEMTDGKPEMADLAKALILSQIMDVVRWMVHLFQTWVYHWDKSQGPGFLDTGVMRSNIQQTMPALLGAMSGHRDILDILKDDSRVGSLLFAMVFVTIRGKHLRALMALAEALRSLLTRGAGCRWEVTFFRCLELKPLMFGKPMARWIYDYVECPLDKTTYELIVILTPLLDCITGHDVLLDAVLGQAVIRPLTSILCRVIVGLASPKLTVSRPEVLRVIGHVADFLRLSFLQGGAPLIFLSAREGLFRPGIFQLLELADTKEPSSPDTAVSSLVDAILPFVVSPSVLKSLQSFSGIDCDYRTGPKSRPARLLGLNAAMERLNARLSEELEILVDLVSFAQETGSLFRNPYKFCDNEECPFGGRITQLGRCKMCQSAYYCSRQCQKVVWESSHRLECKEVVSIRQGGSDELSPLLTTHEHQYLRRTVVPRFNKCRKEAKLTVEKNSTIVMDLTKFPHTLRQSHYDSTLPGLTVKAKFPIAKKLGEVVWCTSTVARSHLSLLHDRNPRAVAVYLEWVHSLWHTATLTQPTKPNGNHKLNWCFSRTRIATTRPTTVAVIMIWINLDCHGRLSA